MALNFSYLEIKRGMWMVARASHHFNCNIKTISNAECNNKFFLQKSSVRYTAYCFSFSSIGQSSLCLYYIFCIYWSVNGVKVHIEIKYTCDHIFSFWALQGYKTSTPIMLEKTFPADRELRMTQQGEADVGLPFKLQQQKWQHTFETWHRESKREETLFMFWRPKMSI